MDGVRGFIRERRVVVSFISAFVLGTLFGLIALGWYAFPVQWYNTDIEDLRPEHAEVYLELVADSFAQTSDLGLALERVERVRGARRSLEEVVEMMNALAEKRQSQGKTAAAQRLSVLAAAVSLRATGSTPEPPKTAGRFTLSDALATAERFALPIGIAVFVILAAVLAFILLRRRPKPMAFPRAPSYRSKKEPLVEEAEVIERDFESLDTALAEEEQDVVGAELGYFQAVYHHGDSDFDAQFPIQGPSREFLGECGVGVRASLVDEGEAQKVSVFEVWLFDKRDIRTVIGLLASEHAYKDETYRTKLATRGPVAVALPGALIELQTLGLRLRAKVRDASYGTAQDAPPRSYLSDLVLDLMVDPAPS